MNRFAAWFRDQTPPQLLAYVLLVGMVFLAGFDLRAAATASGVAGLVLLLFANLDKLKLFRLSAKGIEAETREVKQVVEQARVTLAQVQLLSVVVARVVLLLVQQTGRLGGIPDEDAERIRSEVLATLDKLHLPRDVQDAIQADWHRLIIGDYCLHILGSPELPRGISPEQTEEWKAIRRRGHTATVPPEEVENWLRSAGKLTPFRVALLEDYRYYLQHRKHRRPEVWKQRDRWQWDDPDWKTA